MTHDAEVAKVSVVGLGMRTHTGVATTMFEALAEAGINIQMITTSEIKISVLVDRAGRRAGPPGRPQGVRARPAGDNRGLAPFVALARRPATRHAERLAGRRRRTPAQPAPGMEDLVISGVELDERPGADHAVQRPRPARLRRAGLPARSPRRASSST